jgi:hypothetical protein
MALISIGEFKRVLLFKSGAMKIMNFLIIILFLITNSLDSSRNDISQEYIPLNYLTLKTFLIINPCHTEKSILIRNNSLYKFNQEESQWKRICVSKKIFDNQVLIYFSI